MSETQPNIPEEKLLPVLRRPDAITKITLAVAPLYKDKAVAEARVQAEVMEFNRTLNQIKPEDLAVISQEEIFRVAVSSMATGLSWAAEEKNFYLTTRSVKTPTGWGKGLELAISPNGETSLRRSQGIIKMLDGPHCVYEGDTISNFNQAKNTLDHNKQFPPTKDAKVIAVYEFVLMPDGRQLLRFFDQNDFDRWAFYSRKQNTPKDSSKIEAGREYANALYFSGPGKGIDPGFAQAKCQKHGFKGIPKCKTFGIPIQPDPDEPITPTVYDHGDAHVMADDTPVTNPNENNNPEVIEAETEEF